MLKLQGVLPALVTPFDPKGALDFAALGRHMTALRAAGVAGAAWEGASIGTPGPAGGRGGGVRTVV